MSIAAMRCVSTAMLAVLLSGCASYCVHEGTPMSCSVARDPRLQAPTPVFGGVAIDIIGIGEGLAAPFRSVGNPHVDWCEIFIVPFAIIDAPLSLVADLFYLPSDMRFRHQWRIYKKGERRDAEDE